MENVVIVNGKRTPFGKFGGALKSFSAVDLGAIAVNDVLDGMVGKDELDLMIFANCQTNAGISPVRQTIAAAGLPLTLDAINVERACCSSMTAAGLAYEKIMGGHANIILVGGQESLSNVSYLVPDLRWGKRHGDITLKDPLIIRNPYLNAPMAQYAGEVGVEWGCGREMQDEWAVLSHHRAAAAQEKHLFDVEFKPIEIKTKKGTTILDHDENVRADTSIEKVSKMTPVLGSPTVTAANASSNVDGASALLIMTESEARKRGLKPLARIVAQRSFCGEPRNSPLTPGLAAKALMDKCGMNIDQMALIEINEAFASMPLVSTKILADEDPKKTEKLREITNVNGGGISIGHPVAATGTRLIMTMIYELRRRHEQYGLCCICGAIGQGDSIILEAMYD